MVPLLLRYRMFTSFFRFDNVQKIEYVNRYESLINDVKHQMQIYLSTVSLTFCNYLSSRHISVNIFLGLTNNI